MVPAAAASTSPLGTPGAIENIGIAKDTKLALVAETVGVGRDRTKCNVLV